MISLGEWLADEVDNRYEVTRVEPFYLDTETLKECCRYVDTLERNVTMGYEVSLLEKLGFYVISRHLGYKTPEEIREAYEESLEEHESYYKGFSYKVTE